MRLDLGSYGMWRMISAITPEMAEEAEDLGYTAIWVGGSPRGDLEKVEMLIKATKGVPVVTGIVNIWREPAGVVAASYRRIVERHPDRFVLGVGVGHPEATSEYRDPLGKVDEYLNELEGAGVPPDRLVLAALGPKVLRLAANGTAGAHPYLTTPRHTGFARDVLGKGPLLAPEHKVVLDTDLDRARARGREVVTRYLGRVNYRNNLAREGWTAEDMADGGSDRLIDALVLHGEAETVAAGLTAHLEAGADHVGIQVLDEDPMPGYRELAGSLFPRVL